MDRKKTAIIIWSDKYQSSHGAILQQDGLRLFKWTDGWTTTNMGAEAAGEQATGTMGNESGGAKKADGGPAHMTSA